MINNNKSIKKLSEYEKEKLSDYEKEIYKILEKELSNIQNIIKGNIFIAIIYLLKYINELDKKYWILFLQIFETLSYEEQIQVLNNISTWLNNKNKKDINLHNKVKRKIKDE